MLKKQIIIVGFVVTILFGSGGFDYGTATGKGQLELDFTWNPFDLIEFGQTYIVGGYGLTDCLDLHAYFSHQADGDNNYYFGVFYQFLKTKHLDLATAIGMRQYLKNSAQDIFAPQLLYNIKIKSAFSIGGAFIPIQRLTNNKLDYQGTAFDISVFIPLTKLLPTPKFIDEIKLVFGLFSPGLFDPKPIGFLPTYSIDVKFKKFR